MKTKRVVIVGAGPGGLSAGMLLAHNGYQVDIYEQNSYFGGRNGHIQLGDYLFDIGPTFFLMKSILEEIFRETGRNLEEYVKLYHLDPMYRLSFSNEQEFFPSTDRTKMRAEMERIWPGSAAGYERYMTKERIKYDKLIPCLQMPYSSPLDYLKWQFLSSLPYLDAHKSLYNHLGNYFNGQDQITSFCFQAKYIGMSPWKAPATFSIISFIEHAEGVYHIQGGLHRLSEAMAKVVKEEGGSIHLNKKVKRVLLEKRRIIGIELDDNTVETADYTVINADFAHAMTHLFDDSDLKKWNKAQLEKKLFSCSTFMLYLGVNKIYDDIPHHSIVFAEDYRRNVEEISETYQLSEDCSFYIQNAGVTDQTLAPAGKSTIYVLVPVPNLKAEVNWREQKSVFREKIYTLLETRGGLKDLRKYVEAELIVTPDDWLNRYSVYNGATFNLGHNTAQMLSLRPHNQFEEFRQCYLVGGGTHPGSGLPTIYESGRISANLIMGKSM
jgi:phytoene desaturase